MYLSENYQKKWQPVLEHPDLPKIGDAYKRAVTTVILENQEKATREDSAFMTEASPANFSGTMPDTGGVGKWDPVLISLVRRAMPNLIAYDICGVQPMTGPTGLIFAMKSRVTSQAGAEALFDEADSDFSSRDAAGGSGSTSAHSGTNPATLNDSPAAGTYTTGDGMTTTQAETLGDGTDEFAEMAFSIDKVTVTAKSRALKAEYTMELAQDLKAIHGLDAETELANILSSEILAEINREVVRTVNDQAKIEGVASEANLTGTAVNGQFNLDTDSSGRWSVEKFKGLMYHIERNANVIARQTRRGKGNFIMCSSDVASALAMAGVLDYAPALSTNLSVDDTGSTFAGILNGSIKVYIDPYYTKVAQRPTGVTGGEGYCTVGYRGTNPFDAGVFYCPYVPLQMVRAVGEDTFQPKIGFKTRYGMVSNPFVGATPASGLATANTNSYYRSFEVLNLL